MGGTDIKYLFWNLKGKNLLAPLRELIIENSVDILALAECKGIDCQSLINSLHIVDEEWKLVEVCPKGDMKVFAKRSIKILPHMEEKNYALYKVDVGENKELLAVVHLCSALYSEENIRDREAENISRIFKKVEEELFGEECYRSIVVGDFNLQPYSEGIIGVNGFNATKSKINALKISRSAYNEKRYFYFNPTWKLMGENKLVQGTYYNSSDSQGKSIYWYSFDEVLIRPYFIDKFNWDYFSIVERTKKHDFVPNSVIDKDRYSDHLPLKFEIMEE